MTARSSKSTLHSLHTPLEGMGASSRCSSSCWGACRGGRAAQEGTRYQSEGSPTSDPHCRRDQDQLALCQGLLERMSARHQSTPQYITLRSGYCPDKPVFRDSLQGRGPAGAVSGAAGAHAAAGERRREARAPLLHAAGRPAPHQAPALLAAAGRAAGEVRTARRGGKWVTVL